MGEWFLDHGWIWVGYPGAGMAHGGSARAQGGLRLAGLPDDCRIYASLHGCRDGPFDADNFDLCVDCRKDRRRSRFAATLYRIGLSVRSGRYGLPGHRPGGELFDNLAFVGLDRAAIGYIKGLLFAIGFLWSVYLGYRILAVQGVAANRLWAPLGPGVIGSLLVAVFWWPAIFIQ